MTDAEQEPTCIEIYTTNGEDPIGLVFEFYHENHIIKHKMTKHYDSTLINPNQYDGFIPTVEDFIDYVYSHILKSKVNVKVSIQEWVIGENLTNEEMQTRQNRINREWSKICDYTKHVNKLEMVYY